MEESEPNGCLRKVILCVRVSMKPDEAMEHVMYSVFELRSKTEAGVIVRALGQPFHNSHLELTRLLSFKETNTTT
ncbi:hypothetical protein J6590_028329 [Homalodisca vitripennis]|nr:hypothetical protein J6590_028329 [Homalodisca vitripennis]